MSQMPEKPALAVPSCQRKPTEEQTLDCEPDPINAADRRRMKAARAEARLRVAEISRNGGGSPRDVFRREVGTTVRSASPFLLALLASLETSVDDVVDRIEPSPEWPRSPGVRRIAGTKFLPVDDWHGFGLVSTALGWTRAVRVRDFGHGLTFNQSGDDWARLEIVGHSLEVEARIGGLMFETLFGMLRITLERRLPETLAAGCVGRSIESVIEHAALCGRGWVITGIEEPVSPTSAQALIVATGSTAYRMPWAR